MKYDITRGESKFSIRLASAEGEQDKLFKMLMSCVEGSCRRTTNQYEALQSIDICVAKDHGSITLKAKAGEAIDEGLSDRCMRCTVDKVSQA